MEKLFTSSNGDFDIQKKHINGKGDFVVTSGVKDYGVLGKSNVVAKIFDKGTITVDMFGYAFYRQFNYKMVTHARVFSLRCKKTITDNQGLFIANSMSYFKKIFGYENMCSWDKIKNKYIMLPILENTNDIDFEFMDSFIKNVEELHVCYLECLQKKSLELYLNSSDLLNYELTKEEEKAIADYNNYEWKKYNLKKLFGNATRGRRLKSSDRVQGSLPFVTAGETNVGISDFIGNKVNIFEKNTITIDMFGSAKYRNYQYGGDDHIAVVHTEKLEKNSVIFLTAVVHKTSHNGQFSYGKNFYPKDADSLDVVLPVKNGKIDYAFMNTFINAIHKMVIKDFVFSSELKINEIKSFI